MSKLSETTKKCSLIELICVQKHGERPRHEAGLPRQLRAEDAETEAGEVGQAVSNGGAEGRRPGLPGQAGYHRPYHPPGAH